MRIRLIVTGLVCLVLASCLHKPDNSPDFQLLDFHTGSIEYPSELVEFGGQLWVSELLSKRVITLDASFAQVTGTLTHPNRKDRFRSPHHFAMDGDRLYFSEGWGNRIFAYDGQTVESFDLELNAPHGICRQGDWLYIADSLNSRLVRVSVTKPDRLQVYSDPKNRIAYGRQILCRNDGIWVANSYEQREGLNPGVGGNVIVITDFTAGLDKVVAELPHTNITGIAVIEDRILLIGQWQTGRIEMRDLSATYRAPKELPLPNENAGPPYGMYYSQADDLLYVAFIGDIFTKSHQGGIAVYKRGWEQQKTL